MKIRKYITNLTRINAREMSGLSATHLRNLINLEIIDNKI